MRKILKNITIILILILSSPYVGFSQKCKVEIDPFSGEKKVAYGDKQKTIYVELSQGQVLWNLDIVYKGEYNTKLKAGSKLSFKLENGEAITLITNTALQPISKIYYGQVFTSYIPTLIITKENLDKFSSSKVKFFRYPDMNGGYIDHEIKGSGKRYWKKFFKAMECMHENYSQ